MNRLTAPLIGFLAELKRSPLLMLLCAIILLGFGLRVWGINFGLPYIYHPDEGFEVNRALQLASGSFDFSRIAKGGYFYLLFVEFGVLFVFLKIFGVVDSARDFAIHFISDPSYVYLTGRLSTAIIGTLCLVFTYKLATQVFSKKVGLVATLLLAVNTLHVQHSHYITVDIPLTCLCLIALLYIVSLDKTKNGRNHIFAAIFIALASMTKLPGVVLFLPFFVAHMKWAMDTGKTFMGAMFAREWIGAVVVFLLVYVVGNPGVIVHFKGFMMNIFGLYGVATDDALSAAGGEEFSEATYEFNPITFYLLSMRESLGLGLLSLGALGLVAAIIKRHFTAVLLILFIAIFFLGLALAADAEMAFTRYVLPFLPLWLIFSAAMVVEVADYLSKRLSIEINGNAALLLLMTLGLSSLGFTQSLSNNAKMIKLDSRTEAKIWMEQNLPADAKVLIEGMTAQVFKITVPLNNSVENLKRSIELFNEYEEYGKAKYFALEIEANKGKRYDLLFYIWDNIEDLGFYKDKGVDYIILRPADLTKSIKYFDVGPKFLEAVRTDPDFELAKVFEGEESGGNGPLIEIYRRK